MGVLYNIIQTDLRNYNAGLQFLFYYPLEMGHVTTHLMTNEWILTEANENTRRAMKVANEKCWPA